MFRFNKAYFFLAVLLFITELLIGFYVNDSLIRPYGGDFFVVILIYCFVKTFVAAGVNKTAAAVLLFSYIAETLQYFKITVLIGLKHSKLANIIIGNSFSWSDIVAYTLGIIVVVLVEKLIKSKWASAKKITH